jgi:hypothetical protein
MVGNKSDLVEKRKVSDEEAQVRSCLCASGACLAQKKLSLTSARPTQAAAEEFGLKMLTCSALDRPSVIRCLGTLAADILDSKRKRRT